MPQPAPPRVAACLLVLLCLGAAQAPRQRPDFATEVDRVRVDVLVTDGDGEFIDDLTLRDFVLLEDGVEQPLLSAVRIDLEAGEVQPVLPGVTVDEAPAPAAEVSPNEYGALIYFIESRTLDRRARQRFLDAWNASLAGTDELTFPHSVYMSDHHGRLLRIAPLTRNLQRLRAIGMALKQARFFERLEMGGFPTTDIPKDRRDRDELAEVGVEVPDLYELSQDLHTFDLLQALIRDLGERPGRKALIWVSTGLYTRLRASRPFQLPSAIDNFFDADTRMGEALARTVQVGNSAGVSLYGVDPSLVSERRSQDVEERRSEFDVDLTTTSPDGGVAQDPLELELARRDAPRDALVALSKGTGGRSYAYAGPSVTSALQEIQADNSRYYLLTYATPEPVGDGEYHDVEVRVRRSGAQVRARDGYVDGGVSTEAH